MAEPFQDQPGNIEPLWFVLPVHLRARGAMTTQANGEHGRIRVEITVSEMGADWEIDAVHWAPTTTAAPPRRSP